MSGAGGGVSTLTPPGETEIPEADVNGDDTRGEDARGDTRGDREEDAPLFVRCSPVIFLNILRLASPPKETTESLDRDLELGICEEC